MNTPIIGTGGYPLITFHMKNGKFDSAEVEGNTDEQNAAFTERLTARTADDIAAKMAKVDENTKPNCEGRNGRLVSLKALPVSCFGALEHDKFPETMREKIYNDMYEVFSGKAGVDTVEKTFRDVVNQMHDHMYNEGYPTESKEYMEQLVGDTYDVFRMQFLLAANNACNDKGRELYPPKDGFNHGKYYDSEFYYKSEDVNTALMDITKTVSKEQQLKEPNLTSKCAVADFSNNFNSAWRAYGSYAGTVDPDVPPPRNFSFYMNGTSDGFGEIKIGDYTKRFSNSLGSPDMLHYKIVGDTVQVSGKDFDNADEINRFLDNLCYFDTFGMMNIGKYNLWKKSPTYRQPLDLKA